MKTTILDVPFDTYTKEEALLQLVSFLEKDKNHILITPNPEIVLAARNDQSFMKIIKEADLVVPDGIGVVIASKFNKVKIKERVPGYELMIGLFDKIKNKDKKIYFLGGGKLVAELAKKNMEEQYKGLSIVGTHDGYFDEEEEKKIIDEIIMLEPDVLLIGLGCPKQEKWAYKYKDVLPVKLSCCIGGSLDVMSGTVKRAPKFFQKFGLEWFYRLLKQPSRFFRMLRLPLFMLIVVKEKIKEIFNGRNIQGQ